MPLDQGALRMLLLRSSLVFVVTAAIAGTVIVGARAAEPTDPRQDRRARVPRPRPLPQGRCEIAGSGSNVPLVRRLARAFEERHPGERIVVHDSIGSSGGVRATLDSVVHIGLVSRPLEEAEARAGLRAIAHVRVPVVLGAHPSVRDSSLPMSRLVDLVRGRTVKWSDGRRAVLLHRERGDSSNRVLLEKSTPLRRAYRDALGRTHFRVLFHETEMVSALAQTPGSVGFVDLGVLRLVDEPLALVRIDGLDPDGADYPYMKDLFFVVRGEPRGVAARFLEFVRTSDARELATNADYRPL
ncbi:MAG: substrate-binding domain-containing protein [Deltaproteobacteria bacterium]|nr:substrate-binding domain-containing protein [Deltaproteobacteria bacterium]